MSATELARAWDAEARREDDYAITVLHNAEEAARHRGRSEALRQCASELRAQPAVSA